MQITVNGERREMSDATSVAALVRDLNLDVRRIAVEHNRVIVPRSAYEATHITDGDRLEIIAFIGGG